MMFTPIAFALLVTTPVFGVPLLNTRDKRSDDAAPNQAEVSRLASELLALQAKHIALQHQVDQLQAAHDRRVIFAAYIDHEPNLVASDGATLLFEGVITNIGSAYNPATGVFTAPYDGNYVFFFSLDISGDNKGVDLRKNGHKVVAANNDFGANTHVSTGVTLALKANDVITVTFYSSSGNVDAGIESVFAGFMLP